ncbi:MAG: hypothetical protein LUJ09_09340 [Firmicutes bacterium]|nr:hypothetical protein [Bacillota bacterium]
MKNAKSLYIAWAVMYILCTALGFIPNPEGVLYGVLVCAAVCFYLPAGVLLYEAIRAGSRRDIVRVRNLSLLSLGLTMAAIIANFLSFYASDAGGKLLYWLLIVVSTPMICGQSWLLGMFGWACLLMVSLKHSRKAKKRG